MLRGALPALLAESTSTKTAVRDAALPEALPNARPVQGDRERRHADTGSDALHGYL